MKRMMMEIGRWRQSNVKRLKVLAPLSDYTRVLEENIQTSATMLSIRSTRHVIFTESSEKLALNGLDTKRFAVYNIRSIAFGHRDIPMYQ
jgi:hypothetical protein